MGEGDHTASSRALQRDSHQSAKFLLGESALLAGMAKPRGKGVKGARHVPHLIALAYSVTHVRIVVKE